MASVLGLRARLSVLRSNSPLTTFVSRPGRTVTPARTAVCSSSGAILPKPKKVSAARQLTVVGVAITLWRHYRFQQLTCLWMSTPWRWSNVAVSVVVCDPGEADPLRPYQDCSGSGALLVCGDSDQQELCCAAGGARHLRARGRRRRRLTQGGVCGASCLSGITCLKCGLQVHVLDVPAWGLESESILQVPNWCFKRALKLFLSFAGFFFFPSPPFVTPICERPITETHFWGSVVFSS